MTIRSLIVAACLALAAVSNARAGDALPVVLGADPRYDACMSDGEIVGLDPKGDGFLSVRSGPGGSMYSEIDRLYNRDKVWVCGYRNMPWYPVVYDRGGRRDCLAHVRNGIPKVYRGPCRAGWIHSRYVKIIAG